MSDSNPFYPPEAELVDTTRENHSCLNTARSTPFSHGANWLIDGFRYFFKSPFIWLLLTLFYISILTILSIIPAGSVVVYILMPILFAGIMRGCKELDNAKRLQVSHLFAGISEQGRKLALLGLLYLVSNIILFSLAAVFFINTVAAGSSFENFLQATWSEPEQILMFLLMVLLTLALYIPITMLFWFSPALVLFHNSAIFDALAQSFIACLKNILPYFLYSIVLAIVCILALVPIGFILSSWIVNSAEPADYVNIILAVIFFGIETLLLIPVFMASIYAAYKDIFEY